jgi:hypothetical protein
MLGGLILFDLIFLFLFLCMIGLVVHFIIATFIIFGFRIEIFPKKIGLVYFFFFFLKCKIYIFFVFTYLRILYLA